MGDMILKGKLLAGVSAAVGLVVVAAIGSFGIAHFAGSASVIDLTAATVTPSPAASATPGTGKGSTKGKARSGCRVASLGDRAIARAVRSSEAQVLGITLAQLATDLKNKQTIEQLASAKSLTQTAFQSSFNSGLSSDLQTEVQLGIITQAREQKAAKRFSTVVPNWSKPVGTGAGCGVQTRYIRRAALSAEAQVLGISPQQLATDLKQGQSISQLASAKGVSESSFQSSFNGDFSTNLQHEVKLGLITQKAEQAATKRFSNKIPLWSRTPKASPTPTPQG
jgi:AraC-like DNA-binding protein